jgi:hypothetical protein
MVASPLPTPTRDALAPEHYPYFLERAFNFDHIQQVQAWGVRSISLQESLKLGIKKYDPQTQKHLSDGGIWFPFTATYGQVRFNQPLTLKSGKQFKYLSPRQPAKAWIPPGAHGFGSVDAITEGWADAAAPSVRGVRTAAIVGTYNVVYSVDRDCGVPLIYDSDGWMKPQVMRALILGAIWTNGRVNLFPQMEQYPSGGGCEFFKSGHSIADYQQLINEAMLPMKLIQKWIEFWPQMDKKVQGQAIAVATEAAHWIHKPDLVLSYLQQCRDEKLPAEAGTSPQHEETHIEFLAKAIEEE